MGLIGLADTKEQLEVASAIWFSGEDLIGLADTEGSKVVLACCGGLIGSADTKEQIKEQEDTAATSDTTGGSCWLVQASSVVAASAWGSVHACANSSPFESSTLTTEHVTT